MALVLDAAPVLALPDADDPHHHEACVGLVESLDEPLAAVCHRGFDTSRQLCIQSCADLPHHHGVRRGWRVARGVSE